MSETYEFSSATPIKRAGRQGAGRKPTPNPFLDAVRAIAGQVNADGTSEARKAPVVLDIERGETYKQRYSRIRRQLTAAGKLVAKERSAAEPFMIVMDLSVDLTPDGDDSASNYTLTFWDRDAGK